MTIRVLVADDQAMVREGFSVLLGAQPDLEVVGEAVDGRDAVAKCCRSPPTDPHGSRCRPHGLERPG